MHSLKYRILLLGLLFQCLSCIKKTQNFRTATLWSVSTHEIPRYSMRIPKRCNCQYYAEESAREKIYTFSDSSYIFLADGATMGLIPREAVKTFGQKVFIMFTPSNDTTTIGIDGVDSTGRFYSIKRTGGAIYGYQRVPASNRSKFDIILKSLSTQFFPKNSYQRQENKITGNLIYGNYIGKCKRF